MKPLRIWLVGFGTVGRWVMRALDSERERLAGKYGIDVTVVGLANARDGLIYAGNGLDLPSALGLASKGRSIAGRPGVRCWPSTIDGLRATEADLLVEVTASPSADGEPEVAHIREALRRGIPVRGCLVARKARASTVSVLLPSSSAVREHDSVLGRGRCLRSAVGLGLRGRRLGQA